jgi:hypothetical protein
LLSISPAALQDARQLSTFATLLANAAGHIDRAASRDLGGAAQRDRLRAETLARLSSIAQHCNQRDRATGFFSQLNAAARVGFCNAFSKFPSDAQCRTACAGMAGSLRRLDGMSAQHVSLLANAFAKWPQERECRQACGRLAQWVTSRSDANLARLTSQELALLVNAFSRHPDLAHCRAAGARMARQVADSALDLDKFTPQHLSNLANGFSRWPDDASCRVACERLAEHVTMPAVNLRQFNSQCLSNLANAFAKWPDDARCRRAGARLAQQVTGRLVAAPAEFTGQNMANLANAFSKWSDDAHCQLACTRLAQQVANQTIALDTFNSQDLSNLANAFAARPDDAICRAACATIARQIRNRPAEDLAQFTPQGLATLAIVFGKQADNGDCRAAGTRIAQLMTDPAVDPAKFELQAVANLANAFAKWPDDAHCPAACLRLAQQVANMDSVRFDAQSLSHLANAFSKWPGETKCRTACARLAQGVTDPAVDLGTFAPQSLATLANAFSKWPDNPHCRAAQARVAQQLINPLADFHEFTPQNLSNLANAFVKWPDDERSRLACVRLAQRVADPAVDLATFTPQAVSNLANAFVKWPDDEHCHAACVRLGQWATGPQVELGKFSPQELSNLANGLAKWPEDEQCRAACARLAEWVAGPHVNLDTFRPLDLANLTNTFAKWPGNAHCLAACARLARQVANPAKNLQAFKAQELTNLANAFSRCLSPEAEDEDPALLQGLSRIARHVAAQPDMVAGFGALDIGQMLKALRRDELEDGLNRLAPPCLARLSSLRAADNLKTVNLETVGTLCIGLRPLLRNRRLGQHKQACAQLLHQLQPIVERKLGLFLQQSQHEEACSTRCPALSCYQILATYRTLVQADVKVGAPAAANLDEWTKALYARSASLIESDLSDYSWNTIAQLEAEEPSEILDRFVENHLERITAKHPPSSFNLEAAFDSMDHPPQLPQGQDGLMRVPQVNLRGRRVGDQMPEQYSVLARLTQGQVPLALAQLPGQMSKLLLGRIIHVDNVPYRLDLFGGSKMKIEGIGLDRIFSESDKPSARNYGQLFAAPLADSAPHSDLARLMTQMFPYQESFYYFQRMMMSSPPGMSTRPDGHVLEGNFRIGMLPDRDAGVHPFHIRDPQGQAIALQPHDGCSFIKQSLAQKMAWYERAQDASPYGKPQSANLPAHALQHYGQNDAVAEETITRMARTLDGKAPEKEELYRALTAGLIRGDIAVAVPSADGKVHLPRQKSAEFDAHRHANLLIGKSPYDKPNLRPLEQERVATQDDATARFLSACTAFQYSFVAQQQGESKDEGKAPLMGAKGILVVLPDTLWPETFSGQDLVMSAEDMKLHSRWTDAKHRSNEDSLFEARGILATTNIFPPGSTIAMPLAEQKKLDGDFDGDPLLILANRPALFALVRDVEQQREDAASLKPPKSFTPALDDNGQYRFGRANQIMATRGQVLEDFVGLQMAFLALQDDRRSEIAQRIAARVYEGQDALLGKEAPAYVENDMAQTARNLLSMGIKIGTDAYKSDTGIETYRQVALSIKRLFSQQKVATAVPYGKGLARKLAAGRFDPEESLASLASNPTLAAQVMRGAIARLHANDMLPKAQISAPNEAHVAAPEPEPETKPQTAPQRARAAAAPHGKPPAWGGNSAQHLRARLRADARSDHPPSQAETSGRPAIAGPRPQLQASSPQVRTRKRA